MDVFVSYARTDGDAVGRLVDDVTRAGHRVWFDRHLRGGDDWWQEILGRIRTCAVLVFALSEQSSASQACRAELGYAKALGVPVIPVQVGPVTGLATGPVAEYQVVDGRGPAVGDELRSAIAAAAARRGPLPRPLPTPPDAPFAYLATLGQQVTRRGLRATDQAAIIGQLRQALRDEPDPDARGDARRLLEDLRRHPECTYANAQEIDTVLGRPVAQTGGTGGPARSRRTLAVAALAVVVLVAGVVWWVDRGTGSTGSPEPAAYPSAPAVLGRFVDLPDARDVAVSPDGGRLYVSEGSANAVAAVDAGTGSPQGRYQVGELPTALAVSPDGTALYVANGGSRSLSVLDTRNRQGAGTTVPLDSNPNDVAVSGDGQHVYVTCQAAGGLSVVGAGSTAVDRPAVQLPGSVVGVALSHDDEWAYVTNRGSGTVSVVDTRSRAVAGSPIRTDGESPVAAAVTPDDRFVYTANQGSRDVSVIDTGARSLVKKITVGGVPKAVAVSPDGARVYVANSDTDSVSVIDATTQTVLGGEIAVEDFPVGLAVSSDSRRLYVANEQSSTVSVINTGKA